MKINNVKLASSVLLCLMAGLVGSIFTVDSIQTWYLSLNKPSFNPPNWIFGPVWTALYVLMGISAYLIWEKGISKKEVKNALTLFVIQLVLNLLWSIIFFGLKSPFYALIEIVFLWIAIVSSIYLFYKISRSAAFLLFPYIAWVSFAAILNYFVWQLNM